MFRIVRLGLQNKDLSGFDRLDLQLVFISENCISSMNVGYDHIVF